MAELKRRDPNIKGLEKFIMKSLMQRLQDKDFLLSENDKEFILFNYKNMRNDFQVLHEEAEHNLQLKKTEGVNHLNLTDQLRYSILWCKGSLSQLAKIIGKSRVGWKEHNKLHMFLP